MRASFSAYCASVLTAALRELGTGHRNLAGQLGYVQAQFQQRDELLKALQAPTEASTEVIPHQSAQEGQQTASVAGVVSD